MRWVASYCKLEEYLGAVGLEFKRWLQNQLSIQYWRRLDVIYIMTAVTELDGAPTFPLSVATSLVTALVSVVDSKSLGSIPVRVYV